MMAFIGGSVPLLPAGFDVVARQPVDDTDPARIGHWMQTNSGGRFYPLDPRPEEVSINDVANGLALDIRYGGQGRIDRPYSVAEHLVHCAWWASSQGHDPEFVLAVLLHDAAEAYLNDLPRAVKHGAGAGYKAMEDNVQRVILAKYGLWVVSEARAKEIKEIDRRIVPLEKAAICRHQQPWAYDQFEPLTGIAIQCWPAKVAKALFLNKFVECMYVLGRSHEEIDYHG